MWRVLCCVGLLFTTVNAAGLGEACSDSDPCIDVLGHGESECVRVYGSCEPTCQCDADSYESTVENTCQPVHGCLLLADCDNTLVGSAVCNEDTNTCECGGEIATIDYHGTDYCDRTRLGLSCGEEVSNCLAHLIDPDSARCDADQTSGNCACNIGYMQDPDYETVACIKYPVGANCDPDDDPQCADENAACVSSGIRNNKCLCNDGFTANEDNICQNDLIAPGNLNLPHDAECTTDVADAAAFLCNTDLVCDACLAETPTCQIPLKALGSHCTGGIGGDGCDAGMCGKDFSDCTNGQCMCPEGEHATNYTTCEPNVALDGECTTDLECDSATPGATCDIGVCACVEPRQLHEGVCYLHEYDASCDGDNECLAYLLNPETGACVGEDEAAVCGCVDGYVMDEGGVECRPYHYGELCVDLNSPCEGNSGCIVSGAISRCLCSGDTTWNYNIKNCLHKDASEHITADEVCTAEFDEANSQICEPWLTCGQCSADGDEAPRVCRDTDDLGAEPRACNPGEEDACISNHGDEAVCDAFYDHCENTGVCGCADGHYLDSNWQCAPVGSDDSCESSEQCEHFIRYSVCDPQGCSCNFGETVHTPVPGEVQYCAKSHIGEACVSNDDCLSYRVNPAAGVCNLEGETLGCGCAVDYKPDGEVCVQVSFEEVCDSDCGGSLVCVGNGNPIADKKCECPEDTAWNAEVGACVHNNAIPTSPGDACDMNYTASGARYCTAPEVCEVCYGSDDGVGICSLTEAPSTVTEAPSSVTEALSTVTEDSSTVTGEPPSETEGPPSETDEPPSETDEPPSETEGPPSETEGPPSETEGPPSETEGPPSETDEPPSGTDDPPSGTEDPESTTPDDGSGDEAVLATLTTVVFLASFAMLKNLF